MTDSCGTNSSTSSFAPRTVRSTARAYTNDAVNTPSVAWVVRLARKLSSRRGVNCDWASWSTTMVIEKTSPVTEIIALAMVERRLRAPSGPPSKMYGTSKVNVPSTHGRTTARASAPRTIARGSTQKGRHSRCHGPGRSSCGTEPRWRESSALTTAPPTGSSSCCARAGPAATPGRSGAVGRLSHAQDRTGRRGRGRGDSQGCPPHHARRRGRGPGPARGRGAPTVRAGAARAGTH